jgi:DNA-binding MarR family transcriptional regulator
MGHYCEDSFLPIQRIGFALSKARSALAAEMDIALAETGVTSAYAGTLLLLSWGMAHTSVGLSTLLSVNQGFVSRVVNRLEKRGLVCRTNDSVDRRVVNLTLTETGRHVATRIAEIVPAVLNRRLSGFTDPEFATLCRLLRKLLDE